MFLGLIPEVKQVDAKICSPNLCSVYAMLVVALASFATHHTTRQFKILQQAVAGNCQFTSELLLMQTSDIDCYLAHEG
eukprot:6484745-Amphidinium_carterae.1